jgi:hypothetical protein
MPLPYLDTAGEMPAGLHRATIDEVVARFGSGSPRREAVASRLLRIYRTARETDRLERFIILGSFVTAKSDPNDVDIILVMRDDFVLKECVEGSRMLFEHDQAEREFGASVFWIRPSLLFEPVEEFLAYWQVKRDRMRRGIVEVIE